LYSDLNQYTKYNENDIYAPIQSQKTEKTYELKKVRNPFRVSEGVSSLFGKGETEYSNRELAQMHKVWDSENEKWLDYTAEEQGFLGLKYLGRKALVYAAWDEDGTHFDPFTGKEVRHKKGEWKTDDNGMYYTETIGKKQGYGKEFVAYSDILTKEDSWANNIDFFDSDDKNKSIGGTVAKTVAAFLPYIFPVARGVWGGITAAINLASVLPTFAKMAEGLAVQDGETGFTKSMNAIENYFKKFDDSHSDAGKSSIINFETIMGTLGDVYGQLYQMRAAASLSNLYTKQFTKAQSKSFEDFAKKFGNAWAQANAANKAEFAKNPDSFFDLWKSLAENTPEMK
jgi:YHS domain-containing protein